MVYHIQSDDLKEVEESFSKSKYAAMTQKYYLDTIKRYYYYSPTITQKKLHLYIQDHNNSVTNAALKYFVAWLVKMEKCKEEDISYKFEKGFAGKTRTPIYVSKDEVYEIISFMPDAKNKLLTEIIFKASLRVSEGLGLMWGSFDWFNWLNDKDKPLIINFDETKGGKNEQTDIPSDLARRLYELNIKMCDSRGMPYNYKSLVVDFGLDEYKDLKDYIEHTRHHYKYLLYNISKEAIGKKISPHKLRHSYAQYMLDNGTPLNIVSKKLRHKSLDTTKIYAKTSMALVSEHTERLN